MTIKITPQARKNMSEDAYKYLLLLELHPDFDKFIDTGRKIIKDFYDIDTDKLSNIIISDERDL